MSKTNKNQTITLSPETVEMIKDAYREIDNERSKLYVISGLIDGGRITDEPIILHLHECRAIASMIEDLAMNIADANDEILNHLKKAQEVNA